MKKKEKKLTHKRLGERLRTLLLNIDLAVRAHENVNIEERMTEDEARKKMLVEKRKLMDYVYGLVAGRELK